MRNCALSHELLFFHNPRNQTNQTNLFGVHKKNTFVFLTFFRGMNSLLTRQKSVRQKFIQRKQVPLNYV